MAAGIVPAAGANDGGGSIRIPAACNGLVGLKPTRGLAPFGPATGESMFGMAVQGALTRTVRDAAAIYDAVVGPTPSSVYPTPTPTTPFSTVITTAPRRLRIGFHIGSAINPNPDPEAVAAVTNTAHLLESLGHHVEEVSQPYDDAALARDFLTIWFAVVATEIDEARRMTGARDSDFEADTLAVGEVGRAAGVVAAFTALNNVNEYVTSLDAFHADHDFLLTPTLATPPPTIGSMTTPRLLQTVSRVIAKLRGGALLSKVGILDDLITENLGWVPYTQLANLTGRPAISVPMHWTAAGLPLGVQFVGRLGADGDLLALAAQLEQAQPWFHRYADIQY